MDPALLRIERGRVKGSMTKLKTFSENIPDNKTIEDLETRLEKLEDLAKEFKLIDDILTLQNNDSEYDSFEDKYMEIKVALRRALKLKLYNKESESRIQEQLNTSVDKLVEQQKAFFEGFSSSSSSQIKLPKVDIPPFSGDYKDWTSFRDIFESSIDKMTDLSAVHKLQYLKSLLKGEAASVVKHLRVTEANYKEAWSKLVKRYDKKKQIASAHIKTFVNQPVCSQGAAVNLRRLADTSSQLIRGIDILGGDASGRDPWLIYLMLSKVDSDTRRAWAEETTDEEFPTFDNFIEFLNTRCDALETCDPTSRKHSGIQPIRNLHMDTTARCIVCAQSHQVFKCPQYKAMSISSRRSLIGKSSLCFNCLGSGHSAKRCKSKVRCHHCSQTHHSSLHEVTRDSTSPAAARTFSNNPSPSTTDLNPTSHPFNTVVTKDAAPRLNAYTIFKDRRKSLILLPTAVVNILDASGTPHACRILLDSGSQGSFISEDCVQRLGLQRSKARIFVHGLSSIRTATTKGKLTVSLFSRFSTDHHIVVQAYILDKLTAPQPARTFDIRDWSFIQGYELADPYFNETRRIDFILGADNFLHILQEGRAYVSSDHPMLQNTIFGYVVSGPVTLEGEHSNLISLHADLADIDASLRKFWETEEIPSQATSFTQEEEHCETHFKSTHHIDPVSQRYVVRLPFKKDAPLLGVSVNTAISCLHSLERRFKQNPHLLKEYSEFMEEYKALHHLEPVPSSAPSTNTEHAYLPHHAVFKPESTTTKVRVVFNGSSLTSNGTSLNQKLMVGPKVQRDLTPILLSFRSFKIAMVADIEKMYRQVLVDERDRDYQRILWRSHSADNLSHLRLTTVTYGTSAAPFLATRALKQLTIEFKGKYPLAEHALNNNFYIDDFLGGAINEAEASQLYNQLTSLLKVRRFSLRKWSSNSLNFLHSIPSEIRNDKSMRIDDSPENLKVLGLNWMPLTDCFTFVVTLPRCDVVTKRIILSESSKVFDPLGLVSPVTITFKILLQQLWLQNYDWDDQCHKLSEKFLKLRNDLCVLQELRIPRWLPVRVSTTELHGFSDASELAYAAVVYCRSMDETGLIQINIVASKTRVCSIKQLSVPRLELCAAALLAKLMEFVKSNLNIQDHQCFAWTDSTVVLSWLSDHPRKWKCFVGNRTALILSILPRQQWQHVASSDNPADLASRGLLSSELVKSKLWWRGPTWLTDNWKIPAKTHSASNGEPVVNNERREHCLVSFHAELLNNILTSLFDRYSSLTRILRILSRCFQFTRNCGSSPDKRSLWISTKDQLKAVNSCIRWAQADAFNKEIHCLQIGQPVPSSSRILTLTPFLDSSGILRVGGRLEHSNQAYEARHPAILPKDHIFVKYLIAHLHERYLHAATSLLLSITRQKYWVLSCRSLIKAHINHCITCVRHRAATSQQLMASLPHQRVGVHRAFENVGVDYAGPVYILTRRGRGARNTKAYIVLFICFSTRAIHLELAGDLTSDTFIACLKRFSSRRGIPSNIYSDNGTNFVGANRQLQEVHKLVSSIYQDSLISQFLFSHSISWHFNPPSAPHFGGLWEAGVRSVKVILRKVVGCTHLTYEELNTLLVQIEGLLNSRPLIAVTDDVSSLDVLTPAHFLVGQPLTTIPEAPRDQQSVSLIGRWRLLQQMHQHFWRRWHNEYLSALQHRPKWQRAEPNLSVGDLVIIKEDNLPPAKWILGRIILTHPGKDGLVRVATIRTSHGEVKRPTVKLCKLPINHS